MAISFTKLLVLLTEVVFAAQAFGIHLSMADYITVIGTATLDKIRKDEGNIDTRSIDRICDYLNCQPGDIMEFIKK